MGQAALLAAGIGLNVVGGIYTANQQQAAANKQSEYYNYLADVDEKDAKTALDLGDKKAKLILDTVNRQISYIKESADNEITFTQDAAARDTKTIRDTGKSTAASQRAAMAANGVSLDSVSAEDVILDSFNKERLDEMAVRYNADLKSIITKKSSVSDITELDNQAKANAWEVKTNSKLQAKGLLDRAKGYRMGGANAVSAGNAGALGTLLTTTGSVADSWYKYKYGGK